MINNRGSEDTTLWKINIINITLLFIGFNEIFINYELKNNLIYKPKYNI